MSENMKLTEEELFECLKSLNVPVRMNDLKTPTKEFILDVFQTFLKDLKINIANPVLRPFDAIKHLENPELYEHGQMLLLISSAMTELLRFISQLSTLTITVSDILAPKPKRTKKILCYLIIFWNYYLTKCGMFHEVESNLKPQLQKSEELKSENERLQERYQDYVAKLENWRPPKEELRQISANKKDIEADFEKARTEVVEEYQQLKEKQNQIQMEISNVDVEIINAKEKLNELDQLIISSPEKKNVDVQKIKDAVKDVEQKIHDKEQYKKNRKKDHQSLVAAQEEFVKNSVKQQKIYDELLSLVETAQNVNSIHMKCQEENKNLKELQSTQEIKSAMANFYEQRLAKIQLSKKKQTEEITETLKTLKRQIFEEEMRIENFRSAEDELREKINKEADSVIEAVEKSKKAKVETERVKTLFESQVQNIEDSFRESCKIVVEEARCAFK